MVDINKTLLFSSVANANPATPPAGYTQPTGVVFQARIEGGKFALSSDAYATAFWYDNTVLTGTDIRASVVLDSIAVTAGITAGCGLVDTSGNGWVVLCGGSPANIRVFAFVAWAISGGVLGTDSTVPVIGDTIELRRVPSSGAMTVWVNGVQSAAIGTITSLAYSPNRAAAASRKSTAKLTSLTSTYVVPYGITSIDGDDIVKVGQSGVATVSEGFSASPTPTVTTNTAGASGEIVSGSTNAWVVDFDDRVDGTTFPLLPATVIMKYTQGANEGTGTFSLTKKAAETAVAFTGTNKTDPTYVSAMLWSDGFEPDGGQYIYTSTNGVTVDPDGGVTGTGMIYSWFRPSADKSGFAGRAGKVYYYDIDVNNGVTIVTASGLTTRLIGASKVPISTIVTRRI